MTDPKNAAKSAAANPYDALGDVLSNGFGNLMQAGDEYAEVSLSDITIKPQIREEFADAENTDAEMIASIQKHRVFQPILIRPVEGPRPYELVCGERRCRNSVKAGKTTIPAIIRKMTDEEAADIQFAENVQRKNLTQIELAKRIQHDLNELGSVEAVLEKHNKGRAWLSKILSLLTLPEQAKRLITENISADMEVINTVKTVEKHDPPAAQALVDTLKDQKGDINARETANAVKDAVKPAAAGKSKGDNVMYRQGDNTWSGKGKQPVWVDAYLAQGGTLEELRVQAETPQDKPNEQPGPVKDTKPAADEKPTPNPAPALAPAEVLTKAFNLIYTEEKKPIAVLSRMKQDDRYNAEAWLKTFYDAGVSAPNLGAAVLQSFRQGTFGLDNEGAFALVAFLAGADSEVKKFDLLDILGSVKRW